MTFDSRHNRGDEPTVQTHFDNRNNRLVLFKRHYRSAEIVLICHVGAPLIRDRHRGLPLDRPIASRNVYLCQLAGQFCTDRSSKKEQASRLAPQTRRPTMDKRAAEIERFVRQHNIEHYRKLLGEPTDPLRRQQLQMLLAELEPTQE
jgi:hypothetical protein